MKNQGQHNLTQFELQFDGAMKFPKMVSIFQIDHGSCHQVECHIPDFWDWLELSVKRKRTVSGNKQQQSNTNQHLIGNYYCARTRLCQSLQNTCLKNHTNIQRQKFTWCYGCNSHQTNSFINVQMLQLYRKNTPVEAQNFLLLAGSRPLSVAALQ